MTAALVRNTVSAHRSLLPFVFLFVMAAYTSASATQAPDRRRHCPDCDEAYLAEGAFCLVCGAEIVSLPVPQDSTNNTINTNNDPRVGEADDNLTAYLDLFGIDFQDLLQRFNSSSNNRVISQDYASTLGKIDVDERYTILFNYIIRIGPLKVNSVPANFSPLSVEDVIEAPLIIADPVCGEHSLVNADQIRGSIVLMERGGVSFAQKVKQAQESGAVGLIVAQTNSKWPFVMADSAAELGGKVADIPVCMVSQSDGELLFKWVRSKMSLLASSTRIIFTCEEMSKECSVCQDNMEVGENVLRLSCCHAFHSECIMTWLHKNNNCPMCRHEMPSVAVKSNFTQQRELGDESRENHRQSYFA
jgi:hypothetical protein